MDSDSDQRWCVGVDFGKRSDRTAIAAVQLVDRPATEAQRFPKPLLAVRYLERLPLDMNYPDQTARIGALIDGTPEFAHAQVVVDATGVGVAVADLLREVMRRSFTELTISDGLRAKEKGARVSVPKRELASQLSVVMQQGRLRVAEGLADAAALFDEMGLFEAKISDDGHTAYGARTGHDDLVLSVSYAVWMAERPSSFTTWRDYYRAPR